MSTRRETNIPMEGKKWSKVNIWPIKGPLLLLAILMGALSEYFHWRSAPFGAGLAMIVPVIGLRNFWKKATFWLTVVLLGIAQAPIVIYVSPVLDHSGFPSLLAFAISDCFFVTVALLFICSLFEESRV